MNEPFLTWQGYSEQVLGVFKDNDQNILGLVFDNLNYINNLYESLFLEGIFNS